MSDVDPHFMRPAPTGVRLVVGSPWGERDERLHQGIDLAMPEGTPLYALADGVVIRVQPDNVDEAGRWVGVQYANGMVSRHLHMSRVAELKVGDRVKQGQVIGYVGNTGRSSGPHLHLALHAPTALLPALEAAVGKPSTGWGPESKYGVAIPAEPWVPVDGYRATTLLKLAAQGIPTHTSRARWTPTQTKGAVVIGALGLTLVGVGLAIRWRRRKKAGLGATRAQMHDAERVAEIAENPQHRQAADRLNADARKLLAQGRGVGRKVWLRDLVKLNPAMANVLVTWNRLGWIELVRADMHGRNDPAAFDASEIELPALGTRYHMLVVPKAAEADQLAGPDDWWHGNPRLPEKMCYATKQDALNVFRNENQDTIQAWGGLDAKARPSDFDAVNHKYGTKVDTLSRALWATMPARKPFCLENIDLEALNDTAPGQTGSGFRLPSWVHEQGYAAAQAAHYQPDDAAVATKVSPDGARQDHGNLRAFDRDCGKRARRADIGCTLTALRPLSDGRTAATVRIHSHRPVKPGTWHLRMDFAGLRRYLEWRAAPATAGMWNAPAEPAEVPF